MADQKQQQQIQIKAQDDILKGVYANAVQTTHTREEFVLDFMNIYPWQKLGLLTSRVIVSPAHMKRLAMALNANVKKYEEQHGEIDIKAAQGFEQGFGFHTED